MKSWPSIKENTLDDAIASLNYMSRIRTEDISDFDNLPNRFMAGRKVGKIPTSSTDVAATDRVGDFNYSAANGYFYLLADDAHWKRITLGTW